MGASEAAADRVVVVSSGEPNGGGRLSRRGGWEPEPDAWGCTDWLQSHGVDARLLAPGEVAAAGRRCILALLEAAAVGPDSFLAPAGSAALAAAAREAKRPVWLVAGVGRILPGPTYDALVRRVGDDQAFEVVPLDAVDEIAGPAGPVPRARLARPSCPVAAELLRFSC
jgi:hypothetical protein